jgi:hypothetical protein
MVGLGEVAIVHHHIAAPPIFSLLHAHAAPYFQMLQQTVVQLHLHLSDW